jgi:hypothetical protein
MRVAFWCSLLPSERPSPVKTKPQKIWERLFTIVGCETKRQKHTTGGIPRWSPTLVLVARFSAYVWQSGRDAQFSLTYGRMCLVCYNIYFEPDFNHLSAIVRLPQKDQGSVKSSIVLTFFP